MRKPLVIWGATGHSKVLREFTEDLGFELIAIFDKSAVAPPFPDVPLYVGQEGFQQWLQEADRSGTFAMVAIGGDRGRDRLAMQTYLSQHGLTIASAIHPTAYIAKGVQLGTGCQVLAGAVIGVETRVGDGCIINTNASVDHECTLADGVHVAPGSTLTGCIKVGECSMVGAGSVVLPRVCIGADSVVGAGAVVTKHVGDNSVVVGNPAKFVRSKTV